MSEIGLLRYLMDEAFLGKGLEETGDAHSLMANLATVTERQWRADAGRGSRTIEQIALHVGACKLVYVDRAFGSGQLRFGTPEVEPWAAGVAPPAQTLAWLRRAHAQVIARVARLTDADLPEPRETASGEQRETRWILTNPMQHDLFHAVEIARIREQLAAGMGPDRDRSTITAGGAGPTEPKAR